MSNSTRGGPVRALVLGCGSIGQRHIQNLLACGVTEILGVDPRPGRRERLEAALGIETRSSVDEAWAWEPDLAFVTAPTSLHVPLATAAAERGCHLFIEKPLSHDREGIASLVRLVRERELVTLVGCNLRFHPGLARVRALLEQRELGRIVAARVEVGQYLPDWRPDQDYRQSYSARVDLGGGIILDAIHEFDYIRWLLGEVVEVACFHGQLSRLQIETEDTAGILLRFASGCIGEVHLDYVQRAPRRGCQMFGDEGTLLWDYFDGEVRRYSAAAGEWAVEPIGGNWQPNDMYVDEVRYFLRCVQGVETSMNDVAEAARVLEIALAAKQSAATRQFVPVPR